MKACTAFRLAMLSNGFAPLLDNGKRAVETGWPKQRVTEADVLAWDRCLPATTGMRIDGDLAVIDVDVDETAFIEALAEGVDRQGRRALRPAGVAALAWGRSG